MHKIKFRITLILLHLVQKGDSVFRFCHQGTWHELQEEDCPYGLLFNERITAPCFYSEGKDNTTIRIWSSLCDDAPFVNDKDDSALDAGSSDFSLAQRNAKLQLLQYGISEPPTQLPLWEDVVDMSSCEELCYSGVQRDNVPQSRTSHEEGDSLEEFSPPRAKINETQRMALTDQTLRLGDYLFDELNTEEQNRRADESGPDLRIVQLFKKTIKIISKNCPDPFIPEDFRNRILSGFIFLVQDTGIGEVDDISAEEFEEIMAALRSCENMNPIFRLEGTVCSIKTIVSEIVKILPSGEEMEATYKPAQWQKSKTAFPYLKYDPFVEFAWKAVQVVHGSCFATFKPNANMHHKYTAAMERLFGDKIRLRWENPTQLEDTRMWGTWFLADLDTTQLNFGACISGAYEGAPFAMKLDRPTDKLKRLGKLRRKRAATDETESGKDNSAQNDDTPQSYWNNYRSAGGIREKLKGEVECFATQENKDAVVKGLKAANCPTTSASLPEEHTKVTKETE